MESGDLSTAFFSGDPEPNDQGSDALYIDPLADLESWFRLDSYDILWLRNSLSGLSALYQASFASLLMDRVF